MSTFISLITLVTTATSTTQPGASVLAIKSRNVIQRYSV